MPQIGNAGVGREKFGLQWLHGSHSVQQQFHFLLSSPPCVLLVKVHVSGLHGQPPIHN